MKAFWAIPLLLAGVLAADEAADRRAIEDVIDRLNNSDMRAELFATGTDVAAELRRLEKVRCIFPGQPKVWSEVPSPRFTRPAVQFITPQVAVADFDYLQFGSPAAAFKTPVVAVLKREGAEWKIATLRAMADCPGALKILPAAR